MSAPRLVAFAGSLREGSHNHRLVEVLAAAARDAGAEVEVLRLARFELPLYDGDLEDRAGLPSGAREFKRLLSGSDGYLVASPEYNSSVSGALKNAIDWASRTESEDEPALAAFKGKVCGLVSASPGALGGLRGLVHVRAILTSLQVVVVPAQFALSRAHQAFSDDGSLTDERAAAQVRGVAESVVEFATKLRA